MENVQMDEDTRILMYDGSTKKISKLHFGDAIMSDNSKPIIVSNIFKGHTEMYDIIPLKGDKFTVGKDHILSLKATNYEMIFWDKTRQRYRIRWLENLTIKEKSFPVSKYGNIDKASSKTSKSNKKLMKKSTYKVAKKFLKKNVPKIKGYVKFGDIVNISVSDYLKFPKRMSGVYKLLSTGLNFKEKQIDVDPYILGYWLGDGHTDAARITTIEPEIVECFENFCGENQLMLKKVNKYSYDLTTGTNYGGKGRNNFTNFLKKYNLFGDKHIPKDYLFNSKENRLKLLAGLVDSDGHNNLNTYQFNLKVEKLVDDIIFLVKSLGFRANKKKVKKTCINGKNGPVTKDYFSFIVYGEGLENVPSLLKRKKAHKREICRGGDVVGFKIVKSDNTKYYGFTIEGDKCSRFLLDDFTVI